MADATGRVITTTTTRHEYVLNSPTPVGEVQKAIAWARAEQPENERSYDDTVKVEARDDEVVVWWEETRDLPSKGSVTPTIYVPGQGQVLNLPVSRIDDVVNEISKHVFTVSSEGKLDRQGTCRCGRWTAELDRMPYNDHVIESVLKRLTEGDD